MSWFKKINVKHVALALVLGAVGFAFSPPGFQGLRVTVFDVGQGDAIFVETPSGHQILFDGGPDNSILEKLSAAMSPTDRTLDAVVLTHPHADHLTGLPEALKRYRVGMLYLAGVEYPSPALQALLAQARARQVTIVNVPGERVLEFDDGTRITFLAPMNSFMGAAVKNLHDAMIVARIDYGQSSVLLTGDLEDELENELVGRKTNLRATILKVGHHGSKTSTSTAFLKAVQPEFAIMSLGRANQYGHPDPGVVERLEQAQAEIFRTDLHHDIVAKCDKNKCALHSEELRFFSFFVRVYQKIAF